MSNHAVPREYSPEGRQNYYTWGHQVPHDSVDPWLGLRIDTWYIAALDRLGSMELGQITYSSKSGVGDDVLRHLSDFLDAFRDLVQMRHLILHYQESVYSVAIQSYFVPGQDSTSLLREAETFLLAESRTVTGCLAECDLLVTVRGFDGLLYDRWLPYAMRVSILSDLISRDEQTTKNSFSISWKAFLQCVVASLFCSDNSAVLIEGRSRWQKVEANTPSNAGMLPHDGDFITLIAPPDDTPTTNDEIFTHNIQRLRRAIGSWQRITGNKFAWHNRVGR